jgi:hypothetical protein
MNTFFISWCPTRGPPCCVTRPADTRANYACAVQIIHEFRWLGIPLIVFFTRAVREVAHNSGRDSFLENRLVALLYLGVKFFHCKERIRVEGFCTQGAKENVWKRKKKYLEGRGLPRAMRWTEQLGQIVEMRAAYGAERLFASKGFCFTGLGNC